MRCALVGYLHDLGISDCYLSPITEAHAGSVHGYDVINHSKVNPELGDGRGYSSDSRRCCIERGMGIVQDIVPNHMSIGDPANQWWNDVLENGPSSRMRNSSTSIGTRPRTISPTRFCCRCWASNTARCWRISKSRSHMTTEQRHLPCALLRAFVSARAAQPEMDSQAGVARADREARRFASRRARAGEHSQRGRASAGAHRVRP